MSTSTPDVASHPEAAAPASRLFRATLLSTALLDELGSGFLTVGLPLARDTFRLTYQQAGLLFTAGELASLVIEPGLNLASDRRTKRLPVLAGMVTLIGAFALAALAPSYPWLLLAVAVAFPATGAAVGLSQAALIDARPLRSAQTLARWTLLAGVGDVLAPVAVAAVVALGGGWSALCLVAAGAWLIATVITWPLRFPRSLSDAEGDAGEPEHPWWREMPAALAAGLRNVTLLRWIVVLVMATLMDELFLGFAGLLLHDRLRAPLASVSLALTAQTVGALVGLAVLDRLLARGRIRGARLLPGMALVTLAGVVALLLAPSVWTAAVALFVAGFGASGWYPVAKAAAYDTLPGRSGLVRSIIAISAPIELALPALIGTAGDHFGIGAALAVLGLAPLGVLFVAPRT